MPDPTTPRRRARITRPPTPGAGLDPTERDQWASRFGVAATQIDHDFAISHLLAALNPLADRFVFYGGTALSRTFLPDLRLSEDIDLLSNGARRDVAPLLDQELRDYMEPRFGELTADPWLADATRDTQACVLRVGRVDVQVQLIDGRDYPNWPTQHSTIEQRYAGIPEATLHTYTAPAFAGAKTSAWIETTRNAPRDLYDLWALACAGHIDVDAARLYRRHGPTGGYPERNLLPAAPPSEREWQDALSHQCIPQVTAADAYETVASTWARAVTAAKSR